MLANFEPRDAQSIATLRQPAAPRGFTLIEVLAVVVILAAIAMLVIPAMGGRDDLRANAAARALMADLVYAQNRAITVQSMQYVKFTVAGAGSQGGYGIYSDSACTQLVTNPVSGGGYSILYGTAAGPSQLSTVTVNSTNFNGAGNQVLGFNELGVPYAVPSIGSPTALNSTGTIVLASGGTTLTLSIEPDTGVVTTP